jgi:hypothetical protein
MRERGHDLETRLFQKQPAAGQRAGDAFVRDLSSDRACVPAGVAGDRRQGARLSDVSLADLGRHGAADDGLRRPLQQRLVVDLYPAFAPPDPLGMGAAPARPVHSRLADPPRLGDARCRQCLRCHELLQHGAAHAMAVRALARRPAGAGRAYGMDPCLHRHPLLAAHQALVSEPASLAFRNSAFAAGAGAGRLRLGRQRGAAPGEGSGLRPRVDRGCQRHPRGCGRCSPHRIRRLGHLCRALAVAVRRARHSWLVSSPPAAAHAGARGRTQRADPARRHGAGDVARKRHCARLGVRRPGALHHLPHPGDQGPRPASGRVGLGGDRARPHRRHARHAARLPGPADRRHRRDAAVGRGCRRHRRLRARRAGGTRAPDHRGVRRHARLDDVGRGQAALRRAVHPQSVSTR